MMVKQKKNTPFCLKEPWDQWLTGELIKIRETKRRFLHDDPSCFHRENDTQIRIGGFRDWLVGRFCFFFGILVSHQNVNLY